MKFEQAVQRQCAHMIRLAQRIDERGYGVMVHGLNKSQSSSLWPYSYYVGGTNRFYDAWRTEFKRKTVLVHVWPKVNGDQLLTEIDGKWQEREFRFYLNVGRAVKLRPIIAALELMAETRKGRFGATRGGGILSCTQLSDRFEFTGSGRAALTTVLRVLEMPHHREILTEVK